MQAFNLIVLRKGNKIIPNLNLYQEKKNHNEPIQLSFKNETKKINNQFWLPNFPFRGVYDNPNPNSKGKTQQKKGGKGIEISFKPICSRTVAIEKWKTLTSLRVISRNQSTH